MGRSRTKPASAPERQDSDRESRAWKIRHKIAVVLLTGLLIVAPFVWRVVYRDWQLNRARAELSRLEIAPAQQRLTRLLERYPQHPEVLFWLGRAERRNGDLVGAMSHLKLARKAGADEEQVQLQIRLMEAQAGRIADAQKFAREFTSLNDDLISEEVYEALTQGFMFTSRYRDALECLSYWIDWRGTQVRPRLYRAEILERIENWQQAIKEYESILEFAPTNEKARRAYARVLLRFDDSQRALEQYQSLLELHPEDPELLLGRCKAWEKNGEITLARKHYEQLLSRELDDETRLEVLIGLGKLALFSQEPEKAGDYLQNAVRLDPYNYDAHFHLAAAYNQLKKTERAAEHQARAEMLNAAQERFRQITDVLAKDPGNADLRFEAGELLEQLGKTREAIAWWKAAARITPNHAPTHRRLEEYYRSQGNESQAEKHRQLAERAERR